MPIQEPKDARVAFDQDGTQITVGPSATGAGTHTRWVHISDQRATEANDTSARVTHVAESTSPSFLSGVSSLTSLSLSPSSISTSLHTPRPDPSVHPGTIRRAHAMKVKARPGGTNFRRIEFWTKDVIYGDEDNITVSDDGKSLAVERRRIKLEREAAEKKQRQEEVAVFQKQLGILNRGKENGRGQLGGEDTVRQQFWQGCGDEDTESLDSEGDSSPDSDSDDSMDEDHEPHAPYVASEYLSDDYDSDSEAATDIIMDDDDSVQLEQKAMTSEVTPARLGPHGTEMLGLYTPPVRYTNVQTTMKPSRSRRALRYKSTEPVI